jgi:thiamine-monophosphate kinase
MIDISDGLIQDLGHILRQSNKGAILYEELIPLAKEARNLSEALYMGEDFELLFTLPRCQAKQLLERSKEKFYPIGEITEKKYGFKIIGRRFRARVIKPRGFRHF